MNEEEWYRGSIVNLTFRLFCLNRQQETIGFFVVEKALVKAVPLVINGGINLIKTIINKVGELI